jgi:AraC family transcriptional regulator of adaptative response / DNA-3-methyladenine glycosylase II
MGVLAEREYGHDGNLEPDVCWQAVYSRDARFDGRFYVGAVKTRVYCRSICPVPFARPNNIRWFASAAAAETAGFHPCRRCRSATSPGTPAWLGTSAVVSRALRLIAEGALDNGNVEELAGRVGLGSRHLRRLFVEHLGASPARIAITRRVHFARNLIEETDLPITELAAYAGFRSIRQFNHAMRTTTGESPTELRRLRSVAEVPAPRPGLLIRLGYRPPFHWEGLLAFLASRAIAGVESVQSNAYRRTIEIDGVAGAIEVAEDAAERQLTVNIELPRYESLMLVVERVRRIFDLAADPFQIANQLSRDPMLQALLSGNPGVRVPGIWDGLEAALRAILGERLADKAPRGALARLTRTFGRPVTTSIPGLTHLWQTGFGDPCAGSRSLEGRPDVCGIHESSGCDRAGASGAGNQPGDGGLHRDACVWRARRFPDFSSQVSGRHRVLAALARICSDAFVGCGSSQLTSRTTGSPQGSAIRKVPPLFSAATRRPVRF